MIIRNITSSLFAALSDTPVVLVNGARQTGKSTLVQMLEEPTARRYISLDDLNHLLAARSDPMGFIAQLTEPVTIDEIQQVPELLPCIKLAVDKDKRSGRFLLTGSANVLFLPKVSESLAGRMEILPLQTLSQGELLGVKDDFISAVFAPGLFLGAKSNLGAAEYASRVVTGGYPELQDRQSEDRRHVWFSSYIASLLQKDIQSLFNIEGLIQLPNLLKLLSAHIGCIMNIADISRRSTLPNTTLHRYMSILELMFLIRQLPAWSANVGKRLVKAPKLFFYDTGLASHLLGYGLERLATDKSLAGHLLENFVVSELWKQQTWSKTRCQLYHFRTSSGQEVDVVLEDKTGQIAGIEVKSSATVTPRDFQGLRVLAEMTGKKFVRGIVLHQGDSVVPFAKNMFAMPVECLWNVSPPG